MTLQQGDRGVIKAGSLAGRHGAITAITARFKTDDGITHTNIALSNIGSEKILGINADYQIADMLADVAALGATSVRVEFDATTGLSIKGAYTPRRVHDDLTANGLAMLPLVNSYVLPWADPRWQKTAGAVAPYATHGVVEIANEPNYNPRPADDGRHHVDQYAKMVDRCAAAMPAGVKVLAALGGTGTGGLDYNSGTPSAPVWSQTAAGNGWLLDMLRAVPGLEQRIGGWALHPYGASINLDVIVMVEKLGRGLPIYLTEGGMRDLTLQSQVIRTYVDVLRNHPLVAGLWWYTHRDWRPVDLNNDQTGYGLLDENGKPRPSWSVFQSLAKTVVAV